MSETRTNIPNICVIDEDQDVKAAWQQSFGEQARLYYYSDPDAFFTDMNGTNVDIKFQCVIISRLFSKFNLDIVDTNIPRQIKAQTKSPIFLNWQGYIQRKQLDDLFDGKIFQRYGVKWHTLKLRINRLQKIQKSASDQTIVHRNDSFELKKRSKSEKCQQILHSMIEKADGQNRRKLEFFAFKNPKKGIELLEAIYNRLITSKETPSTCPSQYINSSPIIAARILHDALI